MYGTTRFFLRKIQFWTNFFINLISHDLELLLPLNLTKFLLPKQPIATRSFLDSIESLHVVSFQRRILVATEYLYEMESNLIYAGPELVIQIVLRHLFEFDGHFFYVILVLNCS